MRGGKLANEAVLNGATASGSPAESLTELHFLRSRSTRARRSRRCDRSKPGNGPGAVCRPRDRGGRIRLSSVILARYAEAGSGASMTCLRRGRADQILDSTKK
jgi:hypothetical protein